MKECRSIDKILLQNGTKNGTPPKKNTEKLILLQPPIDPRDYGNARLFQQDRLSPPSSAKLCQTTISILQFLHAQKDNENSRTKINKDRSVLVSSFDLKQAVRQSFRHRGPNPHCRTSSSSSSSSTIGNKTTDRQEVLQRQRLVIDAIKVLRDQIHALQCTSVSVSTHEVQGVGVRVIATSRFIGYRATAATSSLPSNKALTTADHENENEHVQLSNQFAYRIRVENINDPTQYVSEDDIDIDIDSQSIKNSAVAVQLLGRTWKIVEGTDGDVVTINEPWGGVVGKHPVIKPGQVFEYMSGCESHAPAGIMSGHFSMAVVDDYTPSAMVGDINAMTHRFKEEDLFRVPIEPFRLIAAEYRGEK